MREPSTTDPSSIDICIVGAGPAGISMALKWEAGPPEAILIEGGGFDYHPAMQALFNTLKTNHENWNSGDRHGRPDRRQ